MNNEERINLVNRLAPLKKEREKLSEIAKALSGIDMFFSQIVDVSIRNEFNFLHGSAEMVHLLGAMRINDAMVCDKLYRIKEEISEIEERLETSNDT